MLGFYLSGHPLDKFRDELICFTTSTAGNLRQIPDGREVTVGGIITAMKKMPDRKGNMMAFVTLEDFSGTVELVCFSDCYDKGKEHMEIDRMMLVTGRVSTREGEAPKVVAAETLPLEKLTERFNCQLVIKVTSECSDETLDRALAVLDEYRGSAPVLLAARENGSEVYIKSKKYAVTVDFKLLDSLKGLLGDSAAYLRPLQARNS